MGAVLRTWIVPVLAYALLFALLVYLLSIYEPVRVAGASMEPALVAGDIVIVRRGEDLSAGDIALVREPGRGALLHRIVGPDREGALRLKGDANPIEDLRAVKPVHVTGTVVRVIPAGAMLARWRR